MIILLYYATIFLCYSFFSADVRYCGPTICFVQRSLSIYNITCLDALHSISYERNISLKYAIVMGKIMQFVFHDTFRFVERHCAMVC